MSRIQWSLTQTVAPTAEPISLESVKDQCRISTTEDLHVLYVQAKAARVWCETYLYKQLMPATYRLTLDRFPEWRFKMPMPPLATVSSITYLDSGGTLTTLSPSLYILDTYSHPGRVTPAYRQVWPFTRCQMNAVNITYTAGFANAAAVPETIKLALRQLTAHFYENREATLEEKLETLPVGAIALLDSERCMDFSGPVGCLAG